MNIIRGFAIAIVVTALAAWGVAAAADEEIDTSEAMGVANQWLALVDAGRGRDAYGAAAESFRKGIEEQLKWEGNPPAEGPRALASAVGGPIAKEQGRR